jgi:hypothetical protein
MNKIKLLKSLLIIVQLLRAIIGLQYNLVCDPVNSIEYIFGIVFSTYSYNSKNDIRGFFLIKLKKLYENGFSSSGSLLYSTSSNSINSLFICIIKYLLWMTTIINQHNSCLWIILTQIQSISSKTQLFQLLMVFHNKVYL